MESALLTYLAVLISWYIIRREVKHGKQTMSKPVSGGSRPDSAFSMDARNDSDISTTSPRDRAMMDNDGSMKRNGGGRSDDAYGRLMNINDNGNSVASVLGPVRPRVKKMWQHRFVKLLVVGDSGLGKTTLVRSLLAVPGEAMLLHDGSETSFTEFQKDPEQFCSTVEWDDVEDCTRWVYQIQDTPGYGDDLDLQANIARVKAFITLQNQRWLDMENSATREELTKVVDPRVDVVVFCLPPHRIRNIDLLFMWEISQLVPILPVVTKADTMTIKESVSYRAEIHRKLSHPQLPARRGPIRLFEFSDVTLANAGVPDNVMAHSMRPPYLVVCSNDYNSQRLEKPEPELWPERRYMWGTSEAMNPKHSDLLLLRRLLLQEGVEEISQSKARRYEVWRRAEMKKMRPFRKIMRWLFTTAVTVGVISAGVYATGQVEMPASVKNISGAVKSKTKEVVEATEEAAKSAAAAVLDTPEPPKKKKGLW